MSSGGEFSYPAEVVYDRVRNNRQVIEGLLEHIQADHETIRALWRLHRPNEVDTRGPFCMEDGFAFPCKTRRVLEGERFG